MNKLQAAFAFSDKGLTGLDGGRIAIQGDHIGASTQNGRSIAARTEGAIENDLAGQRLERGKHLIEKNRNVANRSATGIS